MGSGWMKNWAFFETIKQNILNMKKKRKMDDGEWRMEDGGWRMKDGGWRMEDGGWRMEDGG